MKVEEDVDMEGIYRRVNQVTHAMAKQRLAECDVVVAGSQAW